MYALYEAYLAIKEFMEAGGPVLNLIAILTLILWILMLERFMYFKGALKQDVQDTLDRWESLDERQSWYAHRIRDQLVSEISTKINQNLAMIKTLIALAPLLGLLGTVTGMIEVFNVLAVTGGGDPKSMAGGVSQATIPTMSGMVAALSGVFGNTFIERIAEREKELVADHMTTDH